MPNDFDNVEWKHDRGEAKVKNVDAKYRGKESGRSLWSSLCQQSWDICQKTRAKMLLAKDFRGNMRDGEEVPYGPWYCEIMVHTLKLIEQDQQDVLNRNTAMDEGTWQAQCLWFRGKIGEWKVSVTGPYPNKQPRQLGQTDGCQDIGMARKMRVSIGYAGLVCFTRKNPNSNAGTSVSRQNSILWRNTARAATDGTDHPNRRCSRLCVHS